MTELGPNLVVAGDQGVARKLAETGRFQAVLAVASATELRTLSRGGQVTPPAAFMFAPGFAEDVPGAGLPHVANALASRGFTVLVHSHFATRGGFDPNVRITGAHLKLSELVSMISPDPADPAPPRVRVEVPTSAWAQQRTPVASPSPEAWTSVGPAPAPGSPGAQPAPGLPAPGPWAATAPAPPTQGPPTSPEPWGAPPPAEPAAPASWAAPTPPVSSPAAGPAAATGSAPAPAAPGPGPEPKGLSPVPSGWPEQTVGPAAEDPGSREAPAVGLGWPGGQAAPAAAAEAPAKRRGRVVAVASAKGGVGKTSTTVNLAVAAARVLQAAGRPGSAVLVDTNFQQADVARYLSLESPTVLDLFQEAGALAPDTVRGHLAHVPDIDLFVLLGPPDTISADPALINSLLYRRILTVLREAFDYVFIDTPVAELYHTTFTDLILPEADAILVPVEPNRVTLEAARAWLRAITLPQHSRGGGVDPERLSLLLNRARVDVGCTPEDVMDLMPGWRFVGMIPEDEEWMQSVNDHRVLAMDPSPDLDQTLRDILQAVTGDPVFTAPIEESHKPGRGRWKRLLNPR